MEKLLKAIDSLSFCEFQKSLQLFHIEKFNNSLLSLNHVTYIIHPHRHRIRYENLESDFGQKVWDKTEIIHTEYHNLVS